MQEELRPEEILQKSNVKKIPTYTIMLSDGVPEFHTLIIRRPVNSLIIEEMWKIIIQEVHQPFHVHASWLWLWLVLVNQA